MYSTLIRLLKHEIVLFKRAIETEEEKKLAILSADGRKLQTLTIENESMMKEILQLEGERNHIADQYVSPRTKKTITTLSLLKATVGEKNPKELGEFNLIANEYRATVEKLHALNHENGELLFSTNKTIGRLLATVQDKLRNESDTYNANGRNYNRSAQAMVLNART